MQEDVIYITYFTALDNIEKSQKTTNKFFQT